MDLNEAMRLHRATPIIDSAVHREGSTEPWISQIVADMIVARGALIVLETGCFDGATSVYMVDALRRLGFGHFYGCEIDRTRAQRVEDRLGALEPEPGVDYKVVARDVLEFLVPFDVPFDLAFVDDDHTKAHVERELEVLYPKMAPGGLILLHDVWGSTDLKTVVQRWGGLALNFPRLGPAGGLGIIQVPWYE